MALLCWRNTYGYASWLKTSQFPHRLSGSICYANCPLAKPHAKFGLPASRQSGMIYVNQCQPASTKQTLQTICQIRNASLKIIRCDGFKPMSTSLNKALCQIRNASLTTNITSHVPNSIWQPQDRYDLCKPMSTSFNK